MIDLVVFGASGSLSEKMIAPAIASLLKRKIKIRPIGWGRSEKPAWWKWEYIQKDYKEVNKLKVSKKTIFYLALPIKADLIRTIIDGLKQIKINKENWKIAIEKPFGSNLSEAKQIKKELERIFCGEQIFPVDHYLTKDLVKNIMSFRFANPIIEEIWRAKNIDEIKVTAWEEEGIGNRGGYYDQFGAIKDMIQNHLIQVMLLLTINRPKCINGQCLNQAKLALIKKIKIEKIRIGQYKGYRQEEGVDKNSKTETKAVVNMKIGDKKWSNVPITLQTGKKQEKKLTEAEIVFKNNPRCLFGDKCQLLPNNKIVINLYPDNDIKLYLNHGTKVEQKLPESIPLKINKIDIYRNEMTPYEEIIENIVDGLKINFANFDEILESWKVVETIDLIKKTSKLEIG